MQDLSLRYTQLLKSLPSILTRIMAPPWASVGLSGRGMKKARAEARRFLGEHPPKWDDMGYDRQKTRSEDFTQHLEETENKTIADKFKLGGDEIVLEFLRTRTKTIRNKSTRKSKHAFPGLPISLTREDNEASNKPPIANSEDAE